jgi:bifunctional isochorismate lyase/aryl carrier protein
MALPAIKAYSIPTELPTNKVNWVPDPSRCTLLIHDAQNYFINAFTPDAEPVTKMLSNINSLRDSCAELGIPVVFSAQPHAQDPAKRALLTDFWGPGLQTPEQEAITPALAPREGEQILTKWRYSAFQMTELYELLRDSGRDQLIITGVYAHLGCMLTAAEAFMRNFQVFFVADGLADFSREEHELALNYAARRCARVLSTSQLKQELHATQNTWSIERLRKAVAELIDEQPSNIPNDENLVYLGLDSIRLMTLIEQWRRDGIDISFVDLAEDPTLEGVWKVIEARSAAGVAV